MTGKRPTADETTQSHGRLSQQWTTVLTWMAVTIAGPTLAMASDDLAPRFSGRYWFDALVDVEPPAEDTATRLVQYVAGTLHAAADVDVEPDGWQDDQQPRMVAISVSDGQTAARVYWGSGKGYPAAVSAALAGLRDARGADEADWMAVDVVTHVEQRPDVDLDYPLDDYDRSLAGLASAQSIGLALLPPEIMIYRLVDEAATVDLDAVVQHTKLHGKSAQPLRPLFDPVGHELFAFRTQTAFWSQQTGVLPLYRGHRQIDDYTPDDLLTACQQGGEYLTRMVQPDGRFVYHYQPDSDRDVDYYNIVRHAGTLYSMYQLYGVTHDEDLLAAADRATGYLLDHMQTPAARPDAACIVQGDYLLLGSNALAALALVERVRATGENTYLEDARRLAGWMVATQNEAGEFIGQKRVFATNEIIPFVSQYFPGEAIYALARISQVDPQPRYLDAAQRGARWLITVRDGDLEESELIHDHWLLYGMREIYAERPTPLLREQTQKLCRTIRSRQHLKPAEPDWFGGYYSPPRSTPVATRSEGLTAAYRLLRSAGDDEFAGKVLESIRLGVRFQLQTQYGRESALYTIAPPKVLGGFRGSLSDWTVRNDFVQHNISAMLELREILLELD